MSKEIYLCPKYLMIGKLSKVPKRCHRCQSCGILGHPAGPVAVSALKAKFRRQLLGEGEKGGWA